MDGLKCSGKKKTSWWSRAKLAFVSYRYAFVTCPIWKGSFIVSSMFPPLFSVTTAQPHRPRRKRQGLTTGSTLIISMAIHRVLFSENPRSFVEWSVCHDWAYYLASSWYLQQKIFSDSWILPRFIDFVSLANFVPTKNRSIVWQKFVEAVVNTLFDTPKAFPATKATLEKCKLFARIAVHGKQMHSLRAETNQQKYTINGQFIQRALVDMVKFSIIQYGIIK